MKVKIIVFAGAAFLLVFSARVSVVHAAAFTSTQSGNLSDPATWGGSGTPNCSGGDTITVSSGDAVTVDVSCTLGSKASNVGDAFTVDGTSASNFGTLVVPSGVTLTLRGSDTSTNRLGYVEQYGLLDAQSTSIIVADLASDYGSVIKVDGNITANGAIFTIPRGNMTWNNSSGNQVISGVSQFPWDKTNDIYILKLNQGSTDDPGPVSNASGTDLGSFGDTSFTVVTSTALKTPVASYASIQNDGDYYVDNSLGMVWYKTSQATLTLTYNFDYGTWFGSGIVASANTVGSAVNITSSTFDYWGADGSAAQSTEFSGAAIYTDNKSAPGMTTDRILTLNGNTFNYDNRPIQIYDLNSDSSHILTLSNNNFNYDRYNETSVFSDGLFDMGYSGYFKITSSTFNSFSQIFPDFSRGPLLGVSVQNNTGNVITKFMLPNGAAASNFEDNTLQGFGATIDAAAFAQGGTQADGSNTYSGNVIGYAHRAARLDNYMVVEGNTFYRTYHHGMVFRASDGYISNLTVSGNIIYDSENTGDLPGGWTLGYNRHQWIDNITVDHNTFDSGTRCINFNDYENTIVLGTRLTITNNICSNSDQGIYWPANDANDVSFISLSQLDYNDDFNNTGTPSNVTQATVSRGTTNAAGLTIFNPTAIDGGARTLQLVSTGTAGTNLALNVSWGSGTAVNLVADQGTATSGSATSIVDTNKSWTTNAYRGYQVIITSGTGSGQYGMIISNTATQLNIIANNINSEWSVASASGSTYVIVKSDVTATDVNSSQTVTIGVYSPALPTANGTYTDSGITLASHALSANPDYVDAATADFAPTNIALHSVASNGTDIGAIEFKDTTHPSVAITAPADSDTVSSTITISASSSDNVAMDGVQFQIDGTNLGSLVTSASGTIYSTSWDTTSTSNGAHTITAVAYDTSNNTSTDSISVTVANTSPAPPSSSSTSQGITVIVGAGGAPSTPVSNPTTPAYASSSASTAPDAGLGNASGTATLSTADLQKELNSLVALLQELIAEAKTQGIAISLPSPSSPSGAAFGRDLSYGSKGADVAALQDFLISENKGPAAQALKAIGATGEFYRSTQKAVAEFQVSAGIQPANGRFGPKTRAFIKSIIGQ